MGLGFFKDKTEKLMREISKLEPQEFLGVCKILNIPVYEEGHEAKQKVKDKNGKEVEITYSTKPRDFTELWGDMCEKVHGLNREQKRNLDKLVRAANKKS